MTTRNIKIGTDDFAKLLLESTVFVDKSLFIKEFLEDNSDVVLITRPRRWGKSLNMDMLGRFLAIEVDAQGFPLPQGSSINYQLFSGGEVDLGLATGQSKQLSALRIAQHQELMATYQGQFPVISLGFKDVKGSSYQEIEEGVASQINNLYIKHRYLKQYIQAEAGVLEDKQKEQLHHYFKDKLSQKDLKDSLRFLSELLSKHFGKPVYVLIDEYDTPINSAYLEFKNKPEEFEQVLKLFRGLFGATFKTNQYLKQGLITGILRIAKANLFSDLNNVREYTLLDKRYAQYYGFTQEEVEELLNKVPTATPPEKIQHWYNGYTFGDEIIYNPWSIMLCLSSDGQLDHYWLDSGGTALIDEVLLSDEVQQDLQTLVAGGSIVSPIMKQISFEDIREPVGLFSLLLFSGYLNPKAVDTENHIYALSIPNYEVAYIYKTRLLKWLASKLQTDQQRLYTFMSLLAAGKVEAFKERLQELLHRSTSFYQTGTKKAELFYSGFMLGLLSILSSAYMLESERESGMGRADALLIPKVGHGTQALLIEYKVSQDVEGLAAMAEEGLAQIASKGYGSQVRAHAHVKKLLEVCMAFCGKEVALEYREVML